MDKDLMLMVMMMIMIVKESSRKRVEGKLLDIKIIVILGIVNLNYFPS